jgi:hypothetical protein
MPMNVKQPIILTDTVLCSKWVGQMTDRPPGWFTSFAGLGAARELPFMNVRNSTVGIMWNNQDARDQLPFGMRIQSIGVKFFGPVCASQLTGCVRSDQGVDLDFEPVEDDEFTDPSYINLLNREELHSAMWEADLPNHCSLTLTTNQDIRLRAPVAMLTPGYGPIGGGWGWGSPGTWQPYAGGEAPEISCADGCTNLETIQHGDADIRQRFEFPVRLDVPKRANLAVKIKLSQYASDLLQAIHGPYWHRWPAEQNEDFGIVKKVSAALFAIQVTIRGESLIQQRGDYHV